MSVIKLIAGAITIFLAAGGLFLWWAGRPPARPMNMPANAIYIETSITPFKIGKTPGTWVGCWYDSNDRADHCRLTDENGKLKFEDIFLPDNGQTAISEIALTLDSQRTGHLWTGSYGKGIRVPVIYLRSGQILLPNAIFEEAKRKVHFFIDGSAQ
jgi:hypothetical protein